MLDFTVVHPIGPAGAWNKSALRTAYNNKMAKHDHAYRAARQGHQFSFLPCVATTFGVLGPEFLLLLYFMAHAQAEVIVTNHRPDADFKQMVGTCFGASRARIGAAFCAGSGDSGALLHLVWLLSLSESSSSLFSFCRTRSSHA